MKTIKQIRLLIFLAVFFSVIDAAAQHGSIQGTILDDSGEPVMDVNVVIPALQKGTVTDWEGNYMLRNIPAGTYQILFKVIGYKSDTLKGVTVSPGQVAEISHTLTKEGDELLDLDIAVVGTKVTGTTEAVIQEVKESDEVVTAVSSEQISKSQDRSAADVMRRIPGATIIDNRFVMVRGLSQRYNTVMLNGIIAPSTEADSRAFSFDIVPSRLIDRMLVFKSGSADLPAEFAGAIVKIYTRSVVQKDFINVGLTGGFRAGTTMNDFTKSEGGRTDWLGFDNGNRNLPSNFPKSNLRSIFDPSTLANAAGMLPGSWNYNTVTARPDIRFSLDIGKNWYWGAKKLSTLTSLSYSNTFQHTEVEFTRYDQFIEAQGRSQREFNYIDQKYTNTATTSLISNWRLHLNSKNIIEFRNLLNQSGMSDFTLRTGVVGPIEDPRFDVRNYSLYYTTRRMYSGQLQGTHDLKMFKHPTEFSWVAGYSNISREEPNVKRARTQKVSGNDEPYQIVLPSSATTYDAATFYSDLNEHTYALNTSFVTKIDRPDSSRYEVSYGLYSEYKVRDFAARWFSYTRQPGFDNSLLQKPIEELFGGNYFQPGGLLLTEGTNNTDSYDANYKLVAGYAGLTIPIGKFKLNGGIRTEMFNQQLNSRLNNGEPVNVDSTYISPLPFVNLAYNISKKQLIRLTYGKTLNRPYFRELAPYAYYDFDLNADFQGNPDLILATIHNVDARYEIYPSGSEFIAFGVFYKYFLNPIETVIGGSANPVFTFQNAHSAYNYGAEVEIRKSLAGLSQSRLIQNLSLLFNGALIQSQIDLGDSSSLLEARVRPLQGQSPYVINTGIYYNNVKGDLSVTLLYNIYGKRIFMIGNIDNPTIYEMPRNSLDLTITKDLSERMRVSFGIQDIFNAPFRFYQDSDRNEKINSIDEPYRVFRRGQYVTFGFTYKW